MLAIVPVVSLSTVQYGRFLKKLRKQFQDELAASSVIAEETISSARTVRSFAAEDKMAKYYKINIDKSYKIGIKLALATGGFMVSKFGYQSLLSLNLCGNNEKSFDRFITFYSYNLFLDNRFYIGLLKL